LNVFCYNVIMKMQSGRLPEKPKIYRYADITEENMFHKFGMQLYTVRNTMKTETDIRESFRKLKAMGYDQAQTAGCAIPYADFGRIAREEGIEIVGTHDNYGLMLDDPETAMENHRLLGTVNMGVGGMPHDAFASLEGLKTHIANMQKITETVAPHGFKFTYHNHSYEFKKFGGKTILEILMEELDPKNTSFVFDTYWAQHGGADVRMWMEKLAGRIDILHLKDMAVEGNNPYITEIGNGNLHWESILRTAEDIGVKYCIVEQDTWPGDPFDSAAQSAAYLKKYIY